jgi:hypothetical protein
MVGFYFGSPLYWVYKSRLSSNRWDGWPVPTSYKLTPYGAVNAIGVPFREYNVPPVDRPMLILIETCHYLKGLHG